jgi:hypothetical protein
MTGFRVLTLEIASVLGFSMTGAGLLALVSVCGAPQARVRSGLVAVQLPFQFVQFIDAQTIFNRPIAHRWTSRFAAAGNPDGHRAQPGGGQGIQ